MRMPRWMLPALLALGALVGGAAWFFGYLVHVHAGVCDAANCPSESAIALGRALRAAGAAVFGLSSTALMLILVRDFRRRSADGRPAESTHCAAGSRRCDE
jgi:Na+/H+-translocating membrane pyrophosphatase